MRSDRSGNPCPCESGLTFARCCGTPQRPAIHAGVRARIGANGVRGYTSLTPPLRSALHAVAEIPQLFPVRLNFFDEKIYWVKMSMRWYRESVFLDPARIKGTYVLEGSFDWLESIIKQVPWRYTAAIFHSAFCGSTLMSQALAALYHCLPLREPESLGNVLAYRKSAKTSESQKNIWLDRVLRLLSRRYRTHQTVVIKANDHANPLMVDLAGWRHRIPVVFMYTPLDEFLTSCLKTDSRRAWLKKRYQNIIQTNGQSVLDMPSDGSIHDDALVEMATVVWSCNVAHYQIAWREAPDQVRSLDFNQMLADPVRAVISTARFFQLKAIPKDVLNSRSPWRGESDDVQDVLNSRSPWRGESDVDPQCELDKLFSVYSKNNAFHYSPRQRKTDIDALLHAYRNEAQKAQRLAKQLLAQDVTAALPGNLLE